MKKEDIIFEWEEIQIATDIDFHDFRLLGHRNGTTQVIKANMSENCLICHCCQGMNYSTAEIQLQLERRPDYFYSILFTPLLVASLICLSTAWSPPDQRLPVLLTCNMFLLTYKIWFRATQLPPTPGPVLAVDYIDICWTVCLLSLLNHLLVQGLSRSSTTTNTRHLEAFSLDDGTESNQLRAPGFTICGLFYHWEKLEWIVQKLTLPLLFLVCQIGFWCRVAAIVSDKEGLVPFNNKV